MEPPHSYVKDASASVVHHGDYLNGRDDHALCGVALESPARLGETERPVRVCRDCEVKLVEYHLIWWRDRAQAATAELDELRVRYRRLAQDAESQRRRLAALQPSTPVREDSRGQTAARGGTLAAEPRRVATGERSADPASLLEHARRELLELCRQFDEAVPYRRVKATMQAFSDRLSPDDRVLLAREIGAEGSLIRWSTTETETLGWRVTDNPVQGEPDDMWDAWTRDAYQTPKQTRWRLGRSRSHRGG